MQRDTNVADNMQILFECALDGVARPSEYSGQSA